MFLDDSFLTSRKSAYYFTHEWIPSNSVPVVWEEEATSHQHQTVKAFLISGRQCSVSETLFDYSHPASLRLTTQPRAPQGSPRGQCLVVHSIYKIRTFLDLFTAIPNPLYEIFLLLIFACFTLPKWLSSKGENKGLYFSEKGLEDEQPHC